MGWQRFNGNQKLRWGLLASLVLLGTSFPSLVYAAPVSVKVTLRVFDQKVTLDTPAIKTDDYLYVPLRDIAKAMDLDVVFDQRSGEYTVRRQADNQWMLFAIGAREVLVNDRQLTMTVPPLEYKKRVYVPLGTFCWFFGLTMRRDGNHNTYYVSHRLVDARQEKDHLVLETSAPLEPSVWYQKDSQQLIVDFPNTVLVGNNRVGSGKGCIEKIFLAQNQLRPDRARVSIKLNRYEGHQLLSDPVHHRYLLYLSPDQPKPVPLKPTPSIELASVLSEVLDTSGRYAESSMLVLWLPNLAKESQLHYKVKGKEVARARPLYDNNFLLFPAANVLGAMGYSVYYDRRTKTTEISQGLGKTIYVTDGDTKALIKAKDKADQTIDLGARTLERDADTYLPLIPIFRLLGEGAKWLPESKSIQIEPVVHEVSVENINGALHVRVAAEGELDLGTAGSALNPDRIFVDIPNAFVDVPKTTMELANEKISSVRIAQFDPTTVRVALTLRGKLPYSLSQNDKKTTQTLEFVPWVERVFVNAEREGNNSALLVIEGAGEVPYQVTELQDPHRFVIQVSGVLMKTDTLELTPNDCVSDGELSQLSMDPYLGRVVLGVAPNAKLSRDPTSKQLAFLISKTGPLAATPSQNMSSKGGEKLALLSSKSMIRKSLKGKRIVIEAGHGGSDPGSIGPSGTYEANMTLSTSLAIKEALEAAGATVFVPRQDDSFMSLAQRCNYANRHRSDAFISMHYNSQEHKAMRGTETYYFKGADYSLGQAIHKRMINALALPNHGLRKARFFVLNHTAAPSVCIEPAYLSNVSDEALIMDPNFQRKIADAVVAGLDDYYSRRLAGK